MSCTSCTKGADGKPAGCKSNGYCSDSGCNKLDVFDWLAGVPLPGGQSPFDAVEVRFKNTRKGFYRNANALSLLPGDIVTVEASSGQDVGVVTIAGELVRAQMQRKGAGTDTYELRKVLRKSTQNDIDTWHASRKLEDETMFAARKICGELRLDMKVSDVEYQGDGTRATFYYMAEERIDFRELLRRMSDRFNVRVDMKQLGARQEAGRIGGIGSCGRELCCSTWLTDLRTVSTSAARYQQLALNPQKLAGQCGKLKCCLNYELDMYIEAIKSYPSANAKLKTKQGTGMHMKTDIFGEKMWYIFKKPGSAVAMAGFPVEKVREILAQNKLGEEPEVDLHMADIPEPSKVSDLPETDYGNVIDGAEDLSRFDSKIKQGSKNRGRGGKRKPSVGDRPKAQGDRPKAQGDRLKAQGDRPRGQVGERPRTAAPKDEGAAKSTQGAGRNRRRRGPRPDGDRGNGGAPKPGTA
ncbi:MAG: hypothetical protein IPN44_12995 [Flavobacteriales bacterium]|nr:hypothetical protein [Flavobacteriales bacterium]